MVADVLLIILLLVGMDRLLAVTVALLLAQIVMGTRIWAALSLNPLNKAFLDKYTNSRALVRSVTTGANESLRQEDVAFFEKHNMKHSGAVEVVTDAGRSWSHVFITDDGYVLGVVRTGSPHPMIVSRLGDGRYLTTTHQLVPPHESLIVNNVRRANARQLLETHVGVLETLHGDGVSPVSGDIEAIASILRFEHAAWRQLGSYLGSFLAIGTRWQPLVLHTRIPAATILQRGLGATVSIAQNEPKALEDTTSASSQAFPWHEAA